MSGATSTPSRSTWGDAPPRVAETPDIETITHLINAAFDVERFFIDGDRVDAERVRDLFGKGKFLLAEDAAGLAGCVYVEVRGQRGYLGLLSVEPARQRAGLGHRLAIAAEDYLRAAGCRAVDLSIVNLRPELLPFYRRLGYTETGTAPFPADKHTKLPCHFITMSKALDDKSERTGSRE
ncbi:MAG TPA: GNAT family N-acetyltransferase [Terriglobia bacterium]|nr:GNAT family N-acetyltransferase [Terriglobia bacterium]